MIVGRRDTIAAIATPSGSGGIGIVRVSGPDAVDILARLLARAIDVPHPGGPVRASGDSAPKVFPDRRLVHGVVRTPSGERVDEVLAVVMRGPRSFTGEDVAELHGHGGVMNMSRLLRAVIDAGARHADAGEFTRRAFENGRLDLTRAEAILGVIEASSERSWRLAQAQLGGRLGEHVDRFRARATRLLAEVEACIDFPEEGEEYMSQHGIAGQARELATDLSGLAATFALGNALRSGIEVAIVGPVNAGKSSMFNKLIDTERAIVDPAPGTTRDFVEVAVVWQGIRVTLIDTAGAREAESRVEQQGIELGRKRAAEADIRLVVHSAEHALPDAAVREQGQKSVHVISKGDLLDQPETELLVTSAVTGQGIDAVKRAIIEVACGPVAEADDSHVITSERQRTLLRRAAEGFERAAGAVDAAHATEVIALELREATELLAELVGERVGEEVLDELFSRFCIGK